MHHHHGHAGLIYIVYAAILLIGGIYGYLKAKSTPSLIAGVSSAIVAIIAAGLFRHHPRISLILGGLVGLVLSVVFYRRYNESKKPMPAIPVGIISLLIFFYSIFEMFRV